MSKIILEVPIELHYGLRGIPEDALCVQNAKACLRALNQEWGFKDGLVPFGSPADRKHVEASHAVMRGPVMKVECEITKEGNLIPLRIMS